MKGVDTNDFIKKRIGDNCSYCAVVCYVLVGDAHHTRHMGRTVFDVVAINSIGSVTNRVDRLDT